MQNKKVDKIIVVDMVALNKATFDIIVNFERMLNRRLPRLDMLKWLFTASVDGGFNNTQTPVKVFLLHNGLENFLTNIDLSFLLYNKESVNLEFNGFRFEVNTLEIIENREDFLIDFIDKKINESNKECELVCVANENISSYVARMFHRKDKLKFTILTQNPLCCNGIFQEFLSCSLSYSLGITEDEIKYELMKK